jgi:hypothetical protein
VFTYSLQAYGQTDKEKLVFGQMAVGCAMVQRIRHLERFPDLVDLPANEVLLTNLMDACFTGCVPVRAV